MKSNYPQTPPIILSLPQNTRKSEEEQGKALILSERSVDKSRYADDTKNEAEELSSPDRDFKGYSLNMALDIAFFRRVMGQFTTGVTIVTTRNQESIAGLTVNSFTSVSLNPLLVLVCIDLRSQSLAFIRESGVFAVNILSQEQEALSNYFASTSDERYNYFRHTPHHVAATGAPILAGTMGFIDTRVTAEYPGGDHAIFLGQVEAMGYDGQTFFMPGISSEYSTLPASSNASELISSNGNNGHEHAPAAPLLYYGGKYHHLSNRYQHQHPELAPTTTNQRNEH